MSEQLTARPEIMLLDGILKNDANMTKWAIKNGVNPALRDRDDPRAWRLVSLEIRGSYPLYEVAHRGARRFGGRDDSAIAAQLLDAGAPIEMSTDKGYTALHQACVANNTGVARLLIERGAQINARSLRGYTPLHTAVYGRSVECLSMLLAAGADVEAMNANGLDVMAYAAKLSRHDVRALLHARESGSLIRRIREDAMESIPCSAWMRTAVIRP